MNTSHPPHASTRPAMAVTLEAKVGFLGQPDAYPEATAQVDAVETHMSWVFLTDTHA